MNTEFGRKADSPSSDKIKFGSSSSEKKSSEKYSYYKVDETINDKGTNLHEVPIAEPIVSLPLNELNDDNSNSNKGKEIQLVEPTHQETKPNIVERQNEVLNLQDISMIPVEVDRLMTRWKK